MIDRYVPPPTPPLTSTRPDRRVQPSGKGASNYRQDATYLPSKPVWEGDNRSSKRNPFFLIVKSTMRPGTRYYDDQELRVAPRGPSRPQRSIPLQTETRQRAPLPPQSVALLMQQTRQPPRPPQQPSMVDVDPSSHREERRDAPIAPRADRERAREREQQRRSPRARVEDLTSPIHESGSALGNQGRSLYASRTERMETRSSDIQEHDPRRVDPYAVSHGRDTSAENANSDPVLPSTYHSTPPSGPSSSRGRGMLRTRVYRLGPPDVYLIEPPQGPREDPKRRKGVRGAPIIPTSGSNNIPVAPRKRDSPMDGASTQVSAIVLHWSIHSIKAYHLT